MRMQSGAAKIGCVPASSVGGLMVAYRPPPKGSVRTNHSRVGKRFTFFQIVIQIAAAAYLDASIVILYNPPAMVSADIAIADIHLDNFHPRLG